MNKIIWSLFLILVWPRIEDRLRAKMKAKPKPRAGGKKRPTGSSARKRVQAERRQRSHGGG